MTTRSLMVAIVLLWSPFTSTADDKHIALVIGNSAYQSIPPLDNPKNDAALMARTLKDLGFTLIGAGAQVNLDKAAMDRAVQTFGKRLQTAEIALFYYAGHGVQVRGSNYLVPIDANPTRIADVDFQMLDVSLVLRQMEGSGSRLNLVILDACRNSPFGGRGLRGSEPGLAEMRAPEGTLISYATQPGNVARDGSDGNSPYTKALAATIRRPGLDIFQTFNQVGLAVKRATGGEQQPWTSSSPIDGVYYFAGPASVAPVPPAIVTTQPVASGTPHPAARPSASTCTEPVGTPFIPDGRTAALREMIAAHKKIRETNDLYTAYIACIDEQLNETLRLNDTLTPDQKTKMQRAEALKHNAAVDQMQSIADRFNQQVQVFKARPDAH